MGEDQQRYGRRGMRERRGQAQGERDGGEGRNNIWAGRDAGQQKLERAGHHSTELEDSPVATPVPSPDSVWSEEFCAKETSQHPIRGSQTALGTHCHQSSKALGETREQAVSGPRGGARSGLRNHKDEQEAGMERRCQDSATPGLIGHLKKSWTFLPEKGGLTGPSGGGGQKQAAGAGETGHCQLR